jgi:hypothetical protein
MQDKQIAGPDPQRRRKLAVGRQVTIASRSIELSLIANCKIDLQHAVMAAKLLRLWNHASWFRPLTEINRPIRTCQGTRLRGGVAGTEASANEAHSQ